MHGRGRSDRHWSGSTAQADADGIVGRTPFEGAAHTPMLESAEFRRGSNRPMSADVKFSLFFSEGLSYYRGRIHWFVAFSGLLEVPHVI